MPPPPRLTLTRSECAWEVLGALGVTPRGRYDHMKRVAKRVMRRASGSVVEMGDNRDGFSVCRYPRYRMLLRNALTLPFRDVYVYVAQVLRALVLVRCGQWSSARPFEGMGETASV